MSAAAAAEPKERRLVTFQLAGATYALPIADVLEVAEVGRICCVPTLPLEVGGVVNHHGDALPVVRPSALLELPAGEHADPEHLLVLAASTDEAAARLGMPVDRVLGLADAGEAPAATAPGLVVERRPIGGRLMSVLDTGRVLARASEIVERSVGHADPGLGGER